LPNLSEVLPIQIPAMDVRTPMVEMTIPRFT
jgi:hypothetical protein